MFLTDAKIAEAIRDGGIVIDTLEDTGNYSPVSAPSVSDLRDSKLIQPCSVDFSIGRIYVPPAEPRNGIDTAPVDFQTGHQLQPGETAVVQTKERLTLGKMYGAFGFPPAGVSRNSILMTNPGHVDPGFTGHLTFTLINMGRRPFHLRRGERIASLLIFRLSEEVSYGYSERNAASAPKWARLLDQLSPDFGALQTKMVEAAKSAVSEKTSDFENKINEVKRNFSVAQLMVPLGTAAIVAIFGYITTVGDFVKSTEMDATKNSIAKLEAQAGIGNIEKQLSMIAKRIEQLEANSVDQQQGK
ncbi:dCTP deaminase [Agrobacterium tumefaciens]|uniref:dCTP deaminase n=1 Tax=Agrobacterium tumefaciens TaxID=358 RepID=UPI0015727131|nr:hypothetical protein [Agrobacterium tumefaciens]NTE33337.1 hypothetical protein [Agrobacterium tumefaciens]NTE48847.1 hypothetical protein [Agrobacterium tumefaciens]